MALIQARELDAAAIFPQCFDNQYVSFLEFFTISKDGLSYKDQGIAEERRKHTIMEINRSLVYGQQVCVNRASLPNCKPLYELYLPCFVDEDNSQRANPRYQIDEFGELLKTRALVPYLFKGATIEGDGTFNLDVEGERAVKHLLDRCGQNISFLSLGPYAEQVKQNAAKISSEFETRISRLARVVTDDRLYPQMLADVLPCADLVGDLDGTKHLRQEIYTIGDMADDCFKRRRSNRCERYLLREDIYKAVLVRECKCGKGLDSKDCACVTDGRFARIESKSELGARFCLKALVDLVYASNIPDLLYRYIMTPWQLPTRNALQDYGLPEAQEFASIDDVARKTFETSQRLHATATQAMFLPMLEDLTLTDICRIRELPAWRSFMKAQEHLLLYPFDGARTFADFQEKFTDLQLAISKYWTDRRFDGRVGKRYRSFVSAVFQIGKYAVQWGIRKSELFDSGTVFAIDRAIDYVANHVEERVTVGPAKLLFEIFDDETRKIDAGRSWSFEWMRKQVAWERQELLSLLNAELRNIPDSVVPTGSNIADVSGG